MSDEPEYEYIYTEGDSLMIYDLYWAIDDHFTGHRNGITGFCYTYMWCKENRPDLLPLLEPMREAIKALIMTGNKLSPLIYALHKEAGHDGHRGQIEDALKAIEVTTLMSNQHLYE